VITDVNSEIEMNWSRSKAVFANGVASCILTFALSGAFPDGVDPSCGSDHRLRVDWQFGSYQLTKPLSFPSGKTFVMGADR